MRFESILATSDGLEPIVFMLVLIVIAAVMVATFVALKLFRGKKAPADSVESTSSPRVESPPRDS